MTTTSPREVALEALLNRRGGRVPSDALERDLDPGGRSQVTDLVLGVQRNVFLLDAVLRRLLRRPLKEVPARVREVLRLGVYEMVFRDRAPRSVVVDASVALTGSRKALRGLVNAVLRRVAEGAEATESEDIPRARDAIFAGPGRVVRFPFAVLPDPDADLRKHRSLHFTQTTWFVERVEELAGPGVDRLLAAFNTPLPLTLRPVGRTSDELAIELAAADAEVLRTVEGLLEVRLAGTVGALPPLRDGHCVVQDVVPAKVAPLVAPRSGERVLDLCAAPGGKALHLAELMGNEGAVVAADIEEERLQRVREGASRVGMTIVTPWNLGREGTELPEGPFDRVLVDAPCSNTGVLMKRVEARFRLQPETVAGLTRLQDRLLDRAAGLVRPGGRLVYATCSILTEENEERVAAFLARHPGFTAGETLRLLPTDTTRDGGFVGVFERA